MQYSTITKGPSEMTDQPVNPPTIRATPATNACGSWSMTIAGASGTVTPLRRADAKGKPPMTEIDLPIHPSAALFPMLPPDELDELAESIRENGLQDPIVMQRGVMLDGRNRYAACKLAKVEPTFIEFEGDANAYIIAANINRRHMKAGQRAMAVAMIRPETNKGGRGKTIPELDGFAPSRISEARVVLKHTPAAAGLVLQGTKPLANAVAEARSVRDTNKSYDEKFKDFQHAEPTLANRVTYGEVSLLEAQKLAQENAARLDRLGWWNVLRTMEPYVRVFADDLLLGLLVLSVCYQRSGFGNSFRRYVDLQTGQEPAQPSIADVIASVFPHAPGEALGVSRQVERCRLRHRERLEDHPLPFKCIGL